ncbi:MAG: hypothetical protein QXE10_04305 [Desulfurococcaceae archaeon]
MSRACTRVRHSETENVFVSSVVKSRNLKAPVNARSIVESLFPSVLV